MKVLMIDTALDGHHIAYLKEIVHGCKNDFTLVLPEKTDEFKNLKVITYSPVDLGNKRYLSYINWMRELVKIAKKEKPDIVHFLVGDVYYKYFGSGLEMFRDFRTVMTIHWIRKGYLKRLSLKRFCRQVDFVVVHSSYLLKEVQREGIENSYLIQYPQFKKPNLITKNEARDYWKINAKVPVILSLGNTREDKGLDVLIKALNKVNHPFHLLVAGKPEKFDASYINAHTQKYASQVTMCLRYLTDKEVELAIMAADIIALPYKASFNGASGPLGEGVSYGKCIIGSDHGNLGDTIHENHLGYTFETENADSLAEVLNEALGQKFILDDKYMAYKESLAPELFVKRYDNLYLMLQEAK